MATDNIYWKGGAVAVPEVKAYVFALTWAAGDWAAIAINGKLLKLTLTSGDTMTVTAIAAAFIDMINGAAANQFEVRSALGSQVGEFAGLTATAGSAGQVIITGPSNGRPIGTVAITKSVAGNGTWLAVGGAPDVTGTGPNHWTDIQNWSIGAVPDATDTLIFDHRAVSAPLFGMANAYAPARIVVTDGFKYAIGLPEINRDNAALPYNEHQPTYLAFASCADVRINATNAGAIKLDLGSAASGVIVDGTGRAAETGIPPLLLKVNHSSSTVTVNAGTVGICHEPTIAGSVGTLTIGGQGAPTVKVGDTVTLATVVSDSGNTTLQTAVTTLTINGGAVEQVGGAIGATTVNILGGTFYPKTAGNTYGTVSHSAGTIDCTRDSRSTRTFTNYYLYGGSLKDPTGTLTFTNGIRIYPKLSAVALDLPPIKKYSLAAV